MNSDGWCSVSKKHLRSMQLSEDDQKVLADLTFKLGTRTPSHKASFEDFQNYLDESPQFDVLIDGANVGFCNQSWAGGEFKLCQVEQMTRHFLRQQKRVLVVLHTKHIDNAMSGDKTARDAAAYIKPHLYEPLRGTNDDWYWLYAAAYTGAMVVTNDQMRDHDFQMLSPRHFLQWKERHQVFYQFVGPYGGIPKVFYPPKYSERIQRALDGAAWHFPVQGSSQRWLCVHGEGKYTQKRDRESACQEDLDGPIQQKAKLADSSP